MKKIIISLAMLSSLKAMAITCEVMTYEDQTQLAISTINKDIQTVFEENGIRFRTVLQSDGRYTIVILKPGTKGLAAMTSQGSELTLTDADLNRTFACR